MGDQRRSYQETSAPRPRCTHTRRRPDSTCTKEVDQLHRQQAARNGQAALADGTELVFVFFPAAAFASHRCSARLSPLRTAPSGQRGGVAAARCMAVHCRSVAYHSDTYCALRPTLRHERASAGGAAAPGALCSPAVRHCHASATTRAAAAAAAVAMARFKCSSGRERWWEQNLGGNPNYGNEQWDGYDK